MQPIGEKYLGPQGVLSRTRADYEARKPQIRMADLCGRVMDEGGVGLIEAGTGTGKSYAYLIPAILTAKEQDTRAVVSTETIQLQEQIVRKDLPFLQKHLGVEFAFAIAKGIGNFFCERNANEALQEGLLDRPEDGKAISRLRQAFLDELWSGDRTDLKERVDGALWGRISGDDTCSKGACPYKDRCPYRKHRKAYAEADVIVTNHTLYLLHHGLRQTTQGNVELLPPHDIWVADEAHTLADKAADTWGVELRETRPANHVRRMKKRLKTLGVTSPWDEARWTAVIQSVDEAAKSFFEGFRWLEADSAAFGDVPDAGMEDIYLRLDPLLSAVRPLPRMLNALSERLKGQALTDKDRANANAVFSMARLGFVLENHLESLFEDDKDYVSYYERSEERGLGERKKVVTLYRKPVATGWIFERIRKGLPSAEMPLSGVRAAVYTSATLCTGKNGRAWASIASELGIRNLLNVETMRADSPFDWERQVRGYFPKHLPEPTLGGSHNYDAYVGSVVMELNGILEQAEGGAFVLFTSIKDMRETYERFQRLNTGHTLFIQNEDGKEHLLQQFRQADRAVLFGVDSFWTGVDIAGDALSCVVIVKIPFPPPKHPLVEARCRLIEEQGGHPFGDYSLPKAIQKVRQGFGRLIRSREDRGLFAILDTRMHTKRYGAAIAEALPDFPYSVEEL